MAKIYPKPKYDKVFEEGVAWVESLARGPAPSEITGAFEGEIVDRESEFHKAPFIPCGDKGSGYMQCPRCGLIGTYDTFIQVPCRWQEGEE